MNTNDRPTIEQIERYVDIKHNAFTTLATCKNATLQQRNDYLERALGLLDVLNIIRSSRAEVADILGANRKR